MAQGERDSPRIELSGACLTGSSEHEDRAKAADRLARDHGVWLRTAHRKIAVTAEEQSLPAQFSTAAGVLLTGQMKSSVIDMPLKTGETSQFLNQHFVLLGNFALPHLS